MNDTERQTRSHLMELFARHDLHPRHDLGQNFLIDLNLIEFIVREARLSPQDVVLEVGSGTGGMTNFLAREAAHVVTVEVDQRLNPLIQEATAGHDNVTLLNCDVLKNKNNFAPLVVETIREKLNVDPTRRLKLVANLPYNVATPVVSNLVASDLAWQRMVITIQWELAQRMYSRAGKSQYGALSAWLQAQCRLRILKRLPPQVFWPRPKVNSAIVRLTADATRSSQIRDRAFLHDFLRRLFTQRRKLLRGVMAGMYRRQLDKPAIDVILAALEIDPQVRAEDLAPKVLVMLANKTQETIEQVEAGGFEEHNRDEVSPPS